MQKKIRNHQHSNVKLESDEPLHVKIDMPIALRKEVLGAAIGTTNLLRWYLELKSIREHKQQLLDAFKRVYQDIKKLTNELHKQLPVIYFEQLEKQETKIEVSKKEELVQEETTPHDEISLLKKQLEEIESKLNTL